MSQDEAEFGQGTVEDIVVVLDHFVPVSLPVLPSGSVQESCLNLAPFGSGHTIFLPLEIV